MGKKRDFSGYKYWDGSFINVATDMTEICRNQITVFEAEMYVVFPTKNVNEKNSRH